MFDFLKKKIAGFVEKIVGKPEQKNELEITEQTKTKEHINLRTGENEKKTGLRDKTIESKGKEKINAVRVQTQTKPEEKKTSKKPAEIFQQKKTIGEEKPKEKIKLGIITQIKTLFSDEVELNEKDTAHALDDFEFGLLEADVALEVAEQIKSELKHTLSGKKVKKNELQEYISSVFYHSIKNIMAENVGAPVIERIKKIEKRPVKIMFVGPNGCGKTTTIAKIANLLRKNNFSVVIAAGDTFRAAAIEQMEIHGERLGIRVIKGAYGADPTSIAFDGMNYAQAHNIDVVLIDTAGRQETNQNLLNELKKMVRVINPELKIYVGESLGGNAIIEQVDKFNKELKLDGVVLTKMDCDAKGGTVISISKITHVPVLYIGVGQGYEDIEEFNPEKIAKNIAV